MNQKKPRKQDARRVMAELTRQKGIPVQVKQAPPTESYEPPHPANLSPRSAATSDPGTPSTPATQTTEAAPTFRRTRQQTIFADAISNVSAMMSETRKAQKIYGGLCHKLPVLVRKNGLCQALAFIEEKARDRSDRGMAYTQLRSHIATVVDIDPKELVTEVGKVDLATYQRYTREVLSAWVFYKRFAVSMLDVKSGDASEEEL